MKILTSGLLGEQYIGIEPGGDPANIAEGAVITQTQSRWCSRISSASSSSTARPKGRTSRRPSEPPRNRSTGSLHEPDLLHRSSTRRISACLALAVLVTGCATGPDANPRDPLEPFNRGVARFNDAVDEAVLKPVATAYVDVAPSPIRTGVSNFFGNLADLWSSVNAGLQLRPREAGENLMRFSVNTVFGLGGLLDIASEAGIPRTRIDFGQTLGRWGLPARALCGAAHPGASPTAHRDG